MSEIREKLLPYVFKFKASIAGIAAGLAGTTLGHPLDTIKTRLQTQHIYHGAFHCAREIAKNEGFKSFFKGMGSPLFSLTLLNMVNFTTYVSALDYLESITPGRESREHGLSRNYIIAGAASGFGCSLLSTPFEMVKIQSQLDNVTNSGRFKGSWQCGKYLAKNYGMSSLFTGMTVNVLREMTFGAVYFGVYEHSKIFLKDLFHKTMHIHTSNTVVLEVTIAGALSGMTAWFVSFPLDAIKANIQGVPLPASNKLEKRHLWPTAKSIFKQKGFFGFYKGVGPTIVRAMIVSSCRFGVFESVMYSLNKYEAMHYNKS
jgi:solute carrier family 25 carnitine/acylcarnitine transporter 20/29